MSMMQMLFNIPLSTSPVWVLKLISASARFSSTTPLIQLSSNEDIYVSLFNTNACLLKIDKYGAILTNKNSIYVPKRFSELSLPNFTSTGSALINADNDFVISTNRTLASGQSPYYGVDASGNYYKVFGCFQTVAAAPRLRFGIAKYNSANVLQWTKQYFLNSAENYSVAQFIVNNDGTLVVYVQASSSTALPCACIDTNGNVTISSIFSAVNAPQFLLEKSISGHILSGQTSTNAYILRYNGSSNTADLAISKSLATSGALKFLCEDSSGNIYCTFAIAGVYGLRKYNSTGVIQWTKTITNCDFIVAGACNATHLVMLMVTSSTVAYIIKIPVEGINGTGGDITIATGVTTALSVSTITKTVGSTYAVSTLAEESMTSNAVTPTTAITDITTVNNAIP